jgi:hypothetical protein
MKAPVKADMESEVRVGNFGDVALELKFSPLELQGRCFRMQLARLSAARPQEIAASLNSPSISDNEV